MISMRWQGIPQVGQRVRSIRTRFPHLVADVLNEIASDIAVQSQELTPVRTGNLKNSHRVWTPVLKPGETAVHITVGGPPGIGNVNGLVNELPVEYAVIIHEDLDMPHSNGQAKFLETPYKLMEPKISRRVSAYLRKALPGAAR